MKDYTIGIIGLGYVGFPLACLFAKKYRTIGYDRNPLRIEEIYRGEDHTRELSGDRIRQCLATNLVCTSDENALAVCNVYVVGVPTPVDAYLQPDLTPLKEATRLIGKYLCQGDIVIYESTVYPGVTEEVCVPLLEEVSGLVFNEGFVVGYSPERINPGDKVHRLENIHKIVSGMDAESLEEIKILNGTSELYTKEENNAETE